MCLSITQQNHVVKKKTLIKEINNINKIHKCEFKINTLNKQKKPKVMFSHRRNSGQPSHASDMATQMAVNSGIHLYILCFKHTSYFSTV